MFGTVRNVILIQFVRRRGGGVRIRTRFGLVVIVFRVMMRFRVSMGLLRLMVRLMLIGTIAVSRENRLMCLICLYSCWTLARRIRRRKVSILNVM